MARDRASRPEAKPLRLFIAVDVPSGVKAELERAIRPHRASFPQARWTRPEGWHVTLKFLGATWPRLLAEVERTVDEAAAGAAPFDSELTAVGAFPNARRPRVLWAGLRDDAGRLADMARRLDERLAAHFQVEKRALTPHLTIARFRVPTDVGIAASDLLSAPLPSRPFTVDELVLYRSHLSPRGASYEAVHRASLGGTSEGA